MAVIFAAYIIGHCALQPKLAPPYEIPPITMHGAHHGVAPVRPASSHHHLPGHRTHGSGRGHANEAAARAPSAP